MCTGNSSCLARYVSDTHGVCIYESTLILRVIIVHRPQVFLPYETLNIFHRQSSRRIIFGAYVDSRRLRRDRTFVYNVDTTTKTANVENVILYVIEHAVRTYLQTTNYGRLLRLINTWLIKTVVQTLFYNEQRRKRFSAEHYTRKNKKQKIPNVLGTRSFNWTVPLIFFWTLYTCLLTLPMTSRSLYMIRRLYTIRSWRMYKALWTFLTDVKIQPENFDRKWDSLRTNPYVFLYAYKNLIRNVCTYLFVCICMRSYWYGVYIFFCYSCIRVSFFALRRKNVYKKLYLMRPPIRITILIFCLWWCVCVCVCVQSFLNFWPKLTHTQRQVKSYRL